MGWAIEHARVWDASGDIICGYGWGVEEYVTSCRPLHCYVLKWCHYSQESVGRVCVVSDQSPNVGVRRLQAGKQLCRHSGPHAAQCRHGGCPPAVRHLLCRPRLAGWPVVQGERATTARRNRQSTALSIFPPGWLT